MLYLRRFYRVVLWYLLSLISVFIYVNSNQMFHTAACDHPLPAPCSSGKGVSPRTQVLGVGVSALLIHVHTRSSSLSATTVGAVTPPQSSCDKQLVALWGKAKRPTSSAAEMGALEPGQCAGVPSGVGEACGAGKPSGGMGKKGNYFSFNSNISKFIADFFLPARSFVFSLQRVWCEQAKEDIQATLYKCFFPKNLLSSTLWM